MSGIFCVYDFGKITPKSVLFKIKKTKMIYYRPQVKVAVNCLIFDSERERERENKNALTLYVKSVYYLLSF